MALRTAGIFRADGPAHEPAGCWAGRPLGLKVAGGPARGQGVFVSRAGVCAGKCRHMHPALLQPHGILGSEKSWHAMPAYVPRPACGGRGPGAGCGSDRPQGLAHLRALGGGRGVASLAIASLGVALRGITWHVAPERHVTNLGPDRRAARVATRAPPQRLSPAVPLCCSSPAAAVDGKDAPMQDPDKASAPLNVRRCRRHGPARRLGTGMGAHGRVWRGGGGRTRGG